MCTRSLGLSMSSVPTTGTVAQGAPAWPWEGKTSTHSSGEKMRERNQGPVSRHHPWPQYRQALKCQLYQNCGRSLC